MKLRELDLLEVPGLLIGWMNDAWSGDSKIVAFLAFSCLVVIASAISIQCIRWFLDGFVSIVTSLKKLGLRLIGSREKKFEYRRRQQFCGALRSDLDSMAKLENWNDQWFTDLEAEVEADGGYYNGPFNRLIGRSSIGVRRVASLILAIKTSAEKRMVLVGEPGSGKSIALRHLARQLAEIGVSLKGERLQIPLYINLKELPSHDLSTLNADFIENFVKDHVRRGDSDTAEYLREHWQDFKSRGIWFFLFDSFDEIPAILHAPNGSPAVSAYSNAIRQFMDGMGSCRGVLASREYKGPEALPWKQLRILALDSKHKDELIENTSLDPQQKDHVRRHLAGVDNGMFGNPLFLSLLCRYIKKNSEGPTNDLDLLGSHIRSLAERDPRYLLDRYSLSPKALLNGATELAVLFAERPDLSLAPSYDEIAIACAGSNWVKPDELEDLLSALIDFKIGRSDVKEARLGDRRFSFAHRRYQETLFVEYLAKNPKHIEPAELLLDSRWREFTVTLLQSQTIEIVDMFTSAATEVITKLEQSINHTPQKIESGLYYFLWSDQPLLHLLTLLNEGLGRRLNDVPEALKNAISKQLTPRWSTGDIVDKLMVLRHGCLLPSVEYQKMLEWGMESKIELLQEACFTNAQFLGSTDQKLNDWVRSRLADEVVTADNRIQLHKLDALSHRLPDNLGAPIIFNRCRILWKLTYARFFVRYSIATFYWPLKWAEQLVGGGNLRPSSSSKASILTALIFQFVIVFLATAMTLYLTPPTTMYFAIFALLGLGAILLWIGMTLRAEPYRLTIKYLLKYAANAKNIFNKEFLLPTLIVGAIGGAIILGLVIFSRFFGTDKTFLIFSLVSMSLGIVPYSLRILRTYKAKQRLDEYLKEKCDAFKLVLNATSVEELSFWINGKAKSLFVDAETIRCTLRYLALRRETPIGNSAISSKRNLRNLETHLLNKLGLGI